MQDFSLQGRVYLGDNVNGQPRNMQWVHDAGLLQITSTASEEGRNESYSGLRKQSATIQTAIAVNFSLTLHHGSAKNLALGLYGVVNEIAAGSITGESFPSDLQAGDHVLLERGGIADLEIEDSTGTPVELVDGDDYAVVDADGGVVQILSVDSLVQPFVASYDYAAGVDITMFTQRAPVRYLMMTGQNTVDGSNDKLRVRMYRLKFNPISTLDLINNTFGEIALTGTALVDLDNEANDALGGYGRIEMLGAA